MQLAAENGMGCVALANTNHWMRGGTYAWRAAKKGFVFIGWTNCIPGMPPWTSSQPKLGNNPFVIGVPFKNEAIVLDMAMTQFSYGAMDAAKRDKKQLPVYGGYNKSGELTKNPEEILDAKRPVPIGYWKGAGMAMLLDIIATILTAGNSTSDLAKKGYEVGVSQVYITIDIKKLSNYGVMNEVVQSIIEDYKNTKDANVSYPGERVLNARRENVSKGIPVNKNLWDEVMKLQKKSAL